MQEIADILKISKSIKLLVKMKNVSFILWKKSCELFWPTQYYSHTFFIMTVSIYFILLLLFGIGFLNTIFLLVAYRNIIEFCMFIWISHFAEVYLICVVRRLWVIEVTQPYLMHIIVIFACFQCLCFLFLWPELLRPYSGMLVMEGILFCSLF